MKIKVGQCRCMEIIYLVEEAGLVWTADMTPLDAVDAVDALLGGRELYQVTGGSGGTLRLSTARPDVLRALRSGLGDPPVVVRSHGCPPRAARALAAPLPGKEPDPCPKGRENGVQGAARAVPAEPVTSRRSRTAVQRSSEPLCDGCSQPCADGTYASIELGDLLVWAQHVERCP